ncbi:MAG TPA: MbnP family protein [Verrucomicrobiae bacterium]|jgi:cytochrome c peroxidase|nr:MbnP family protein [Verrucomicrobiae bacterium]
MNRMRATGLCAALLGSLTMASATTLQIEITPKVSGENLQPASLRYQTSAGEIFSITRVSYLVSNFALQRDDGSWLEISNSVAWLDFDQNRNSIWLENIPAGEFRTVRFTVGLNTNLNHADAATFPAGHPLNPNLNGLHWSWQGGYIFLALEGLWRNAAGELDGWAYHLARDTNAVRITLAAPLTVSKEIKLEVDFDLATLLNAPRPLSFGRDGSSTHSRDGDPISASLVANLPGAFRVRRISSLADAEIAVAHPKPLYLPAKFKPYPFQTSATFPIPDLPRDNPLLVERVELGRKLFFDRRVSINDAQSCADCHLPEKAFTDGRRTARGAEGESGPRKTMPLFNLAWKREFFWDGRARSLREQVLQPVQNPVEMYQSLTNLVVKLARPDTNYTPLFAAAFGSPEITAEKISLALENYVLTLTSFDAKFDRVLRGEEKFTAEEQRGFELFSTEYDPRRGQYGADCFHCHGGMLFQSQGFANNGLDETFSDSGRAKITGKVSDEGKFAVPSLRNVALTAPYMHDGRFNSLEEVVEHYATGLKRSATLDPNLAKHPDGGVPLSAGDKRALVVFLKTLTDERFTGELVPASVAVADSAPDHKIK